jgi:RecJ-like exonuclease
MKTCPDCNGDGVLDKGTDDQKQCPTCGGSGVVPDDNDDKNNEEIIKTCARKPHRSASPPPSIRAGTALSRGDERAGAVEVAEGSMYVADDFEHRP